MRSPLPGRSWLSPVAVEAQTGFRVKVFQIALAHGELGRAANLAIDFGVRGETSHGLRLTDLAVEEPLRPQVFGAMDVEGEAYPTVTHVRLVGHEVLRAEAEQLPGGIVQH